MSPHLIEMLCSESIRREARSRYWRARGEGKNYDEAFANAVAPLKGEPFLCEACGSGCTYLCDLGEQFLDENEDWNGPMVPKEFQNKMVCQACCDADYKQAKESQV